MTIHAKLAEIQHAMRAPKNKHNDFGGYNYRTAEGILAAFKEQNVEGASLICTDTLAEVAGQIFVTATARLTFDGQTIEAQGHAMHPLQKKGMDASQITGTASSYARKYALNGLFAIEDESQDPDSRDNRKENGQTTEADWFTANLPGMTTADEINAVLPRAKKAGRDVSALVVARANELGLDFDQTTREYVLVKGDGNAD